MDLNNRKMKIDPPSLAIKVIIYLQLGLSTTANALIIPRLA